MGWKWFRLMRAPTSAAPAASALGEGAPYYDTTTKRLRISDGANWSDDTLQPGMMIEFAGSSAPAGFIICDGSAISRTTYAALFTVIGTTWGVGDGSTTFNIPDFREASPYGIGTRGSGVTAHDAATLAQFKDDQGQGHQHLAPIGCGSGGLTSTSPSATFSNAFGNGINTQSPTTDGTNGTPRTGTVTRGKLLGVNFIIKY